MIDRIAYGLINITIFPLLRIAETKVRRGAEGVA
jgi:hypothetical protein